MKLSTKARYGMRAMVDLALHYEKGPILLKDIAKRQEVSMKYLDHIISTLRANGLIESAKTRHSGYVVSRAPCQIKTYEIIKAVEGSLAPVDCVDNPKICHRADFCATLNLWKKLKKSMRDVLEGVTLEDLAKEQKKIIEQKTKGQMYYI